MNSRKLYKVNNAMVATAFEKRDSYELLQRLEPRKCHKLCFFNTSNRLMPLKIILASGFKFHKKV